MEAAHLILAGLGAAVLLVLLALLINLFRAMTRLALAVCALLAFLAVCAVAIFLVKGYILREIPTWPEPVLPPPAGEHPTTRPRPSAAATVTRFLLGVIVVGVVVTGGVVISRHLWQERRKQVRLRETVQQAQIYALMTGERAVTGLPHRLSQGGGNVIVVSGEIQQPTQATLPNGSGWEVLQ